MDFTKSVPTTKKTTGTNTCEFIILHHTGGGSFEGNLNLLSIGKEMVSCHYVVGPNGEVGKIGNDTYIMWHAGNSSWGSYTDMNNYSIGIEVVGPNANGGFSEIQYSKVCELVIYLTELHKIPKQNILRHKDIAPGRKVDIADSFWSNKFNSFGNYINFLFDNNNKPMSKYTDLLNKAIASGYVPLFDTREGDKPLTEKETKELIELAFARFINRINGKG